jgi:WD40 repeat protein
MIVALLLLRRSVVFAIAACLMLAVAPLGASTGRADDMPGWVAYEREWYDGKKGEAYFWVAVARADGRSGRNVSPRPRRGEWRADYEPSWSSSGRLAFVRSLRRATEVLVAQPGSWRTRRVSRDGPSGTFAAGEGAHPLAWSPDARRIAWAASRLFVVDVQRGTRRDVAGKSCEPRWSPDGRALLFLHNSCAYAPQHQSVEVVDINNGTRRVILRGSFNSADWSPDGQQIGSAGNCQAGPGDDPFCRAVFLSNADGSRVRRLPLPSTWVADWVRWIDPSTIVAGGYGKVDGREVGLVRIDTATGEVRGFAPTVGVWPQSPAVTRDRAIGVFTLFGARGRRPALVDVDTGAVTWGRTPKGWNPPDCCQLGNALYPTSR